MSNLISPRPRAVVPGFGGKRNFPIVASQFNATYVQGLIDHTTAESLQPHRNITRGIIGASNINLAGYFE